METKRPCICACACKHMSAPDHPEAGCRFLPWVRGPVTIQGVRDSLGVRTSTGGPEPPLSGLSAHFFRNTWRSRTLLSHESGPEPLPGEQDSGPQGSGCLDVAKDDYKTLA